ncbi:MAG: hypothetical protein OXN25_21510 [Candidatus Poribacteria bacterium]|nr:hypothetical protein [Candidatus Poribacteria bacterium]
MTLIVSVISADGIVIGGDSLSSLNRQINMNQSGKVICPHCEKEHTVKANFQGNISRATFSHTEKVLPFFGKFGIGVFGSGIIGIHSVNFLIRQIEHSFKEEIKKEKNREKNRKQHNKQQNILAKGVTQIAENVGIKLHNYLKKQLDAEEKSLDDFPDDHIFLGFQIVGYDDLQPKTIEVLLCKDVRFQVFDQLAPYASGSKEIVAGIWNLHKPEEGLQPIFEIFSLQEAIDYVDFLINSTIAYQRFLPITPNVGGNIDIALVRPFKGFQWIRQKPLGELLEEGTYEKIQ